MKQTNPAYLPLFKNKMKTK